MGEKEVSRVGERVNPISVRSKRRITDALLELLQGTPFSKITIKDIVDRAGLTRQTFYHNFESKEDVLYYRIDEYIEGFIRYLSAHQIGNWEDILCFFYRYWQEHADFVKLLMENDLMYLLTGRMEHWFEPLKAAEPDRSGLTAGEAKLWFSFINGAIASLLSSWLTSSGGLSARALAKATLSMLDGSTLEKTDFSSPGFAGQAVELLASGLPEGTTEPN